MGHAVKDPLNTQSYSKIRANSMTYEDTILRSTSTNTLITYVGLYNELNGLRYNILYARLSCD